MYLYFIYWSSRIEFITELGQRSLTAVSPYCEMHKESTWMYPYLPPFILCTKYIPPYYGQISTGFGGPHMSGK